MKWSTNQVLNYQLDMMLPVDSMNKYIKHYFQDIYNTIYYTNKDSLIHRDKYFGIQR